MARKESGKKSPTNKKFGKRVPTRDFAAIQALAENVRRLRKARDWSQDELAGEAGIEQNAVSLIENGPANPTIISSKRLRALSTSA